MAIETESRVEYLADAGKASHADSLLGALGTATRRNWQHENGDLNSFWGRKRMRIIAALLFAGVGVGTILTATSI